MKKFFKAHTFKPEKLINERVLDGVDMLSELVRCLNVADACDSSSSAPAPVSFSVAPNYLMTGSFLLAVVVFNVDSLQAVPLDSLRAPMAAMKNEVWSYMYVVKIAAAIMGGVMSVVQQNLMPLGIGGGIAAGIHFFDGVIGDGSAALTSF